MKFKPGDKVRIVKYVSPFKVVVDEIPEKIKEAIESHKSYIINNIIKNSKYTYRITLKNWDSNDELFAEEELDFTHITNWRDEI